MSVLLIVSIMIAAAAIVMLIKWPGSFFAFVYCVGAALVLYWLLLTPIQKTAQDLKIFMAVTIGVGAMFGMAFASQVHRGMGAGGTIACVLLYPALMFLTGAILLYGLAFVLMMLKQADDTLRAALVWIAMISGFCAGPGTILMIIFD